MGKTPIELYQILVQRFNEGELQTLCFHLGIDYDILPGDGKFNKARELITHCERRLMLSKLVEAGKQSRPDISWGDAPEESSNTVVLKSQHYQIGFSHWLRSKWTTIAFIAVVVTVGILITLPRLLNVSLPSPKLSCDKYGVKILSPMGGDVTPPFRVSGTFQEIPDGSTIWVSNAYRTDGVSYYRPSAPATVDKQKKIWYSDIESIGDKGDSPDIVALLAGADGQILITYHFKVGDMTKNWPAITQLPQDTIECDSTKITVR